MASYLQELAQDAVCQSHTGHMTGLWFLPARPLRLNTNERTNIYIYMHKMWRSGIYCMLRKSVVKNILNSRIFDVFLQCCDGCKFCGQEENESTEAVGSADVYCLLISLPYFHSPTVVTTGTTTFNYFSLLTLLLLIINYRYLMN